MSNDIITIDTVADAASGKKKIYHDTSGKRWVSWADKIVLVEKRTYEIQEFKPNQWSPQNAPEKKFTDYVITKAKEVSLGLNKPATKAAVQQLAQSQANGHGNGRHKWDRDEVLSARLSLVLGGWAQSGQIALDGQSVARALAALDTGLKIYNGEERYTLGRQQDTSEDPGDGMEGTEFGR